MPGNPSASEAARKLVRARWDNLTPEQRRTQTAKARAARLAKVKAGKKAAETEGGAR